MSGRVFSINLSAGGVPKLPVREAELTPGGLVGDRQRNRRLHGGPKRALCLLSLEAILALQAEGHPIYPGSTGENLTIAGLDWRMIQPGVCLRIGDALVQITSYTTPCGNIRESFSDGDFKRMSHTARPGVSRVYARVLRPGMLRIGQTVELVASGELSIVPPAV